MDPKLSFIKGLNCTCLVLQESWNRYSSLLVQLLTQGLLKASEIQDNFVKIIPNIQVNIKSVQMISEIIHKVHTSLTVFEIGRV